MSKQLLIYKDFRSYEARIPNDSLRSQSFLQWIARRGFIGKWQQLEKYVWKQMETVVYSVIWREFGEMREDCLAADVRASNWVARVHVCRLLEHVELHGQHVRVNLVSCCSESHFWFNWQTLLTGHMPSWRLEYHLGHCIPLFLKGCFGCCFGCYRLNVWRRSSRGFTLFRSVSWSWCLLHIDELRTKFHLFVYSKLPDIEEKFRFS